MKTVAPNARTTTITIPVGFDGLWIPKAFDAVNHTKRVQLVVHGPDAFAGKNAMKRNSAPIQGITGVEDVAVALAAIAALVAVAGLSVVAVVCLYGMSLGYTVNVKYDMHAAGTVFDDSLALILIPPPAR
jgi:hypothetical protein